MAVKAGATHYGCCELRTVVYDCPNCGHREHQKTGGFYTTRVCCENQPCHEGHPHPPDTFPSDAVLTGFHCPVHGWSNSPHLEQTALF